ncbi:putative evolved d-pantonohydrolase protein [Eutypa lata UCREL1]|uniref:Putative evolved d-pantonohydrolase protein n=1 Tax=Eutypa lata (strain UCR-EL1) TaxID=1287681 RepID=M7TP08_EUTLA|nr:putative evolved d-pantonohydrolase protein [Eutypa lata UCREL1]
MVSEPATSKRENIHTTRKETSKGYVMPSLLFGSVALFAGVLVNGYVSPPEYGSKVLRGQVPSQAQIIDQKAFNVLPTVLPPSESNATTFFVPPGHDTRSLKAKPFHIYDDEFYDVIGSDPTLTLIAQTESDPLFHEAVVWYPPTDEVFFVQNAGAPAAGTGLNKSSIILKIALSEAASVSNQRNGTSAVKLHTVDSNPQVINPNGLTSSATVNPQEPYNTTVLLNNYFGRQFSSLNDIAINPRNNDIYFTDTLYGYLQDFRPAPGLRNQVYRLNDETGAVTVAADGFTLPNDAKHAYVADTGANWGFWGWNQSYPSSIYRFDVQEDGTWENRKVFAYVDSGVPDGVHCDSNGNLYAGCGDGIQVWNPSGKLIGKIYLGEVSANFNFAGDGRMVICAETKLYYVTLAASGAAYITDV